MAEACYMARATTKQQVLDRINKLTLWTNEHGQYTHNAILLIQKGIQHVLVSQFNPSDPGKGMVKLLNNGNSILTRVHLPMQSQLDPFSNQQRHKRTNFRQQPAKPSSLPSPHERRHRRKPTNWTSLINQSLAQRRALSRQYPNWLAATSPMPYYERPMAATSKALTTSRSTMWWR